MAIYELALFFIIYSILGWCAEVVFHTLTCGDFSNRGFLNGPVCPIYGAGMVLIIICLEPLMDESWIVVFIGSFLLTTILELLTGLALDKLFHQRWWDYSGEPFSIGGYICLRFSLCWGFAGLFIMYFVHPPIAHFVRWLPQWLGWTLIIVIGVLYIIDAAATVRAMLSLNTRIRSLEETAARLRELSDDVGERLHEKASDLAEKAREFKERPQVKENLEKKAAEYERLKKRYEELIKDRPRTQTRLLRVFPKARSSRYSEGLERLKKSLTEKRKK